MGTVRLIMRAVKQHDGSWDRAVFKVFNDEAGARAAIASIKKAATRLDENGQEHRAKHPIGQGWDVLNVERAHEGQKHWECYECFTVQKHDIQPGEG